jgi:hypothetical protein
MSSAQLGGFCLTPQKGKIPVSQNNTFAKIEVARMRLCRTVGYLVNTRNGRTTKADVLPHHLGEGIVAG